MKAKTAVFYGRVSTKGQAEEEVSIPAQVEGGHRLAASMGAAVEKVFLDEGRSAFKSDNRPVFKAAIDYAILRGVDYFITWSSSRFARNKIEAALFKIKLDHAGVRLEYVSARVDRDTNEGWLYDSVMEVFDELRSRDTSKDTKRSLIHNAEQGYFVGGLAPFGYVSVPAPDNPKRRKLIPLPEEADRVREVFALRQQGLGGKAIATRYNAMGIRYRGRSWHKAAVLHLLNNPAVIGQTIFNRVDSRTKRAVPRDEWIVLQTHDPIIEIQAWNAVRELMQAAETPEGRGYALSSHAFTGLLRCEHCGGTLVVEGATGRNGRYSYYNCRRARNDDLCKSRRWPAPALDEFLNGVIFDRLLDATTLAEMARELVESFGKWQRAQRDRRVALQAQAETIRDRNRRLYDILELQGRDAPNLGDLSARLRDNNAEIKGIERQLSELDAEEAPANSAQGVDLAELGDVVRSLFTETASVAKLRAFYRSFITGITLRGDQVEIEYDPGQLVAITNPVHSIPIWGGMACPLRTACLTVAIAPWAMGRRRGRQPGASASAGGGRRSTGRGPTAS